MGDKKEKVKEDHLHGINEEARPLAYTSRIAMLMRTLGQFTKLRPLAYAR